MSTGFAGRSGKRPADEPMPRAIKPMLAELGQLPREDSQWSFELKWDGIRAIAYLEDGAVRLESRNGNDLSSSFPELEALGAAFSHRRLVLDGEIVAFGPDGRPSFQALQPRIHSADRLKSARLAQEQPVTYIVFDLLYADGRLLAGESYLDRREALESLGLGGGTAWELSARFDGPGADILRASKEQGLEGVVCKKNDSLYRLGRRSPEWTKVKNLRTQEVVVGGFTSGQGRRAEQIGSLLLGIFEEGALRYVGQVGTGFTDRLLKELAALLSPLVIEESPFAGGVPARYARGATWVEPRLVGEVAFGEWTKDGRLRHPAWRGLRDDKEPAEVVRES